MQINNNNSEDRKESNTKYFPENVYNELKKNMNDFKKDTETSGENMNMVGMKQPEAAMKHDLFSMNDQKSGYKYSPVYYLNQPVNTQMMTAKPINKISEYEPNVPSSDTLIHNEYEGILSDNILMAPKEEYKKAHIPQFATTKNMESSMGSDLIQCIKSPETSPNLISSSLEKYSINSGIDILPIVNELEHPNLVPVDDCGTKYGVPGNTQPPKPRNVYNYPNINYAKQEQENINANKRYYYPAHFTQQPIQNKRNLDGSISYINYNPNKNMCYFNGIRVEYDENTKSYHPNYQVVDDHNPNLKYRQAMVPNEKIDTERISPLFKFISNSQDYNVNNPYYDIDTYYKNTSIKHDIMDSNEDSNYRSDSRYQSDPIARKPKREKKRTVRCGTSAGRPKLNRNHYSCANCNAKSTPQWRYVTGVAVCNACYMRMRKDKIYPGQLNKNKGSKNE